MAVVGLGNPGADYHKTRHNFGFVALDYLMDSLGVAFSLDGGFYLAGEAMIKGETVLLAKPVTFMNLSGQAVADVVRDYSIRLEDLIVFHDDIDLELGKVKLKFGGGAGGHRGVTSIIEGIGSDDFIRIRLGLKGKRINGEDLSSFVLSPFTAEELLLVERTLPRAKEAVELVVLYGVKKAMSLFNCEEKEGARNA
jgi:PTH1 family peptidyl-tRNA hydrolase